MTPELALTSPRGHWCNRVVEWPFVGGTVDNKRQFVRGETRRYKTGGFLRALNKLIGTRVSFCFSIKVGDQDSHLVLAAGFTFSILSTIPVQAV